jgi:PAS domain S-box-containing protein
VRAPASPDRLPRAVVETILDAAADLIVLHDLDGIVFFANESVRQFTGETKRGLFGRCLSDFLAPELAGLWASKSREISERGDLRFDARGYRPDGARMDMDVRSKVLRIEGRVFVLSVARDVTDQKGMERELGARIADLEQFYRMAVDPELAMIALKKEIQSLKNRFDGQEAFGPADPTR